MKLEGPIIRNTLQQVVNPEDCWGKFLYDAVKKAVKRDIETLENILLPNVFLTLLPGWKVVLYLIQHSCFGRPIVGGLMLADGFFFTYGLVLSFAA